MIYAQAENVHCIYPLLSHCVFNMSTRIADDELELMTPITIKITSPDEPVIFWPELDLNPFEDLLSYIGGFDPEDYEHKSVRLGHYYFQQAYFGDLDLSRLAFVSEIQRQLLGVDKRPISVTIGEPRVKDTFAHKLAPLLEQNHERPWNPYSDLQAPMVVTSPDSFEAERQMFIEGLSAIGIQNKFFRTCCSPILSAQMRLNEGGLAGIEAAADHVQRVKAPDWKYAAEQWLVRRHDECKKDTTS